METNLMSTMKIGDDTKKELLKIGASLTLEDGKDRTLEDVVKHLIEQYKVKKPK